MFKENNIVYRYEAGNNETMTPVPGLFYDKETKTLLIENEYDGNYYMEPANFNDQCLMIYPDNGIMESLYYKNNGEMNELWLKDILHAEISEGQKENFKFINGIFCQVRKNEVYGLKYIGNNNSKEITIDARKTNKDFFKIGNRCFAETNIEKINIIENAYHQISFQHYCFKFVNGLNEVNVFMRYMEPRMLGAYDRLGMKETVLLNFITDIKGFGNRIKEAGNLDNFNEIRVGVFVDGNRKTKRMIDYEEE